MTVLDNDVNIEHNSRLGFYVITQKETNDVTPLCCPICSIAMRTREDDVMYREHGCCEWCGVTWVFSRKDEWKAGWRPSPDEISDAKSRRPPMSVETIAK